MSKTSATPPATRRIARSYLADFIAATPLPGEFEKLPPTLTSALVEQLLDRAISVRHVLRSDQLVLTFDLADDPAGWSTPAAAAVQAPAAAAGQPENRDYPGQPGERVQPDVENL